MKRWLAFLLAFLLVMTPTVQSVHAEEISEEELYKEVGDTLKLIFDIQDELKKLGLTFDDLLSIQQKDEAFYEGLRQYLKEQGGDVNSLEVPYFEGQDVDGRPEEEPVPLESEYMQQYKREEADRWAYAGEMAEKNKPRDKDYTEEKKEVVYMFLSHFIDLTTRKIANVNRAISDDGYYSAWITKEDRRVYDTYLKGMGFNRVLFNFAQLAITLKDRIKGAWGNWENIMNDQKKLLNTLDFGWKLYLTVDSADEIKGDFQTARHLWNNTTTSREFVENLDIYLAKRKDPAELREKKERFFVSLLLSTATGGSTGFFKELGLGLLDRYLEEYETFFYNIWWLALVRTNSLRRGLRAERYLKYHGMLP